MKVWSFLNGRKTMVGIVAKVVCRVVGEVAPELQGQMAMAEGYVDIWILGGLTHKIAKVEKK